MYLMRRQSESWQMKLITSTFQLLTRDEKVGCSHNSTPRTFLPFDLAFAVLRWVRKGKNQKRSAAHEPKRPRVRPTHVPHRPQAPPIFNYFTENQKLAPPFSLSLLTRFSPFSSGIKRTHRPVHVAVVAQRYLKRR